MPLQSWSLSSVHKVMHGLPDQRPVQAGFHTHRTRQARLVDMHYELELGVVLSGSMRREYEGWRAILQPGQAWLCGMWEAHGYQPVKVPCEVLVILVLPQMLVNLRLDEAPAYNWMAPFTLPPAQRLAADRQSRTRMLELVQRFRPVLDLPQPLRAVWQRLLLMELLLTLQPDSLSAPPANAAAPSYARINKAVQLVFSSRRLVTASSAALACGLSRNHFNKSFQELMGLSFARFALRYRLSSAAAQFVRSDDPVKKVAADWGFTDASHLHHCFLQHYGCSPVEYRRRRLETPAPDLELYSDGQPELDPRRFSVKT